MKNAPSYSLETAHDLAVNALTFVAQDEKLLSRFLDITGWTPVNFSAPDSQSAILMSALEYLMSEEDILLTFAANSGIEPGDIPKALGALQARDNDIQA